MQIIYRLKGSVPKAAGLHVMQQRDDELAKLREAFGPIHKLSPRRLTEYLDQEVRLYEAFEARYKKLLNMMGNGPQWLADVKAKQEVIKSWLHLERTGAVQIFAISVMSNHVHVLLQHPDPEGCTPVDEFLSRHREYTAFRINRIQEKTGRRFWAKAFYDRDIRRGAFNRTLWYIINNPVVVGLTKTPLTWSGTYVAPGLLEELRPG